MAPDIWIPVKVLPGKEALEYFVKAWKESGGKDFNGEIETPHTNDPGRLMTTDVDNISHCISDIDLKTYDDSRRTVMVKCRFCGPRGEEAMEKFINKDLRLCARTITGPDKVTHENVERIVTFDCITRPPETTDKLITQIKKAKLNENEMDKMVGEERAARARERARRGKKTVVSMS